MRIKADWLTYLHALRRRQLDALFSNCPEKVFENGIEIGAGDGCQSAILAKYSPKLICTEMNPERLGRKNTETIEYQVLDAEEIGSTFPHGHFDLIFSSNMLMHLPHLNKALTGVRDVLKDDGITIHVLPNPFWSFCHVLMQFPNSVVSIFEQVTERGGLKKKFGKLMGRLKGKPILSERVVDGEGYINNLKTEQSEKSFIYRFFVPEPASIAASNVKEFISYRKKRWIKELDRAGFDVIAILKGPVASGHGFGLDFFRSILEGLGFTSEYAYVAVKKGQHSPFACYFAPQSGSAPQTSNSQVKRILDE